MRRHPPVTPKATIQRKKSGRRRFPWLLTWKPKTASKTCCHGCRQKIGLACVDLLYYRPNKIHFLVCTSMVLIYNSELGIIISSESFRAKKLQKKRYLLPSIFIYFLLRQFIFYLIVLLWQFIFYTHL